LDFTFSNFYLDNEKEVMNIDAKYLIGLLGSIIIGLSTWTLVSVVDLKERNSMLQGELLGINKDIGRIYNYVNNK